MKQEWIEVGLMVMDVSTVNQERKLIDLGDGITVEVLREKNNPLIGRVEYTVIIHHPGKGTPAIPDLRVKIAEKLGKNAKTVYIRYIKTEYGIGRSKALINAYKTPELARHYEPKYVIERNKTLEEEIEEAEAQG